MISTKPQISIVLGSYNRSFLLRGTIESIRQHNIKIPYEIIVIDGGSTDGAVDWLINQEDILTILQNNRGADGQLLNSWGYFMNLGFKISQGKYILMISDDCILMPNSIMASFDYFEEQLNNGENLGGLAYYFRNVGIDKKYFIYQVTNKKINHINHGLFLRDALKKVDWAEEHLYSFYRADTDLNCKLFEAGYVIEAYENGLVDHFPHLAAKTRNSNYNYFKQDTENFITKWSHLLQTPSNSKTDYILSPDFINKVELDDMQPDFQIPKTLKKFYIYNILKIIHYNIKNFFMKLSRRFLHYFFKTAKLLKQTILKTIRYFSFEKIQ